MFKKLKDKIAEEVKSSPQRIQQFTQSVTDRIQSATNDDNLFSIGDDDVETNSNTEPGFSNISLLNSGPNMDRHRRSSTSSLASDVSFLPRYESNSNAYHLQSDLDISASEMEDNASSSSQLGHVSKEQVYSAFQKAQMRYHKYRGRYTDLANHYKELERENAKMKSVLVETQDKAIRRVGELKEQCALEQKAKAHLESALRIELDEREYVIKTLRTKVDILQNGTTKVDNSVEAAVDEGKQENLEMLTKYLNDARVEIESLNSKMQEHKANAIVLQSKGAEYRHKISELEKQIASFSEREKENNLHIAQTKMELHTEIQNKDLEIANLKMDIETVKQDLEQYESRNKGVPVNMKLENLQAQNMKLIEKVEALTQKCNHSESELLKLEQHKIEIRNLNETVASLKQANDNLLEAKCKQFESYKKIKEDYETLQETQKGNAQIECKEKEDIISNLQTEIEDLVAKVSKFDAMMLENNQLKEELAGLRDKIEKLHLEHEALQQSYKETSELLAVTQNDLFVSNLRLQEQEKEFTEKLEKDRENTKQSLLMLETKIKQKLTVDYENKNAKNQAEFAKQLQEISTNELSAKELQINLIDKQNEVAQALEKLQNLEELVESKDSKYKELESSHLELIDENNSNMREVAELKKSVSNLEHTATDKETQIQILQDEISLLQVVSANQQNKICIFEKDYGNSSEMQTKINEIACQYQDLLKEKEEIQSKIDEISSHLQSREDQFSDHEKFTMELELEKETAVAALQDKLKGLKLESTNAKVTWELEKNETTTKLNAKISRLASKLERTYSNLLIQRESSAKIQEQLQRAKNDFESFKQSLESVEDEKSVERSALVARIAELQTDLENRQKICENMQETDAALKQRQEEIGDLNEKLHEISGQLIKEIQISQQLRCKHDEYEQIAAGLKASNVELQSTIDTHMKALEELRKSNLKKEQETAEKLGKEILDLQQSIEQSEQMHLNEKQDQILNLKEMEMKYADENRNLKQQILEAERKQLEELKDVEDCLGKLQKENEDYVAANKKLLQRYGESDEQMAAFQAQIELLQDKYDGIKDSKNALDESLTRLQGNYDSLQEENEALLQNSSSSVATSEALLQSTLKESHMMKERSIKLESELSELLHKNDELMAEYKVAATENAALLGEVGRLKTLELEKIESEEINKTLSLEKDELASKLQNVLGELEALKKHSEQNALISTTENNNKAKITALENKYAALQEENENMQLQFRDFELQINELTHERQCLLDEVQKSTSEQTPEVERLHEKIQQYKSLDLTNRSSIEFYETELQKLKNKNEKLNRKLDETLVTLNHCAELSGSTEVEYLRNVLYNYMLGKESLVLARVIAAVCKFDAEQTEMVLQKEQQKQSLMGQLGFL